MHHLDVVACAHFSDPVAAGRAVVDFGRDRLEDVLDVGPGRRRAAGHDAQAMARAFLAAGHAGADVEQPLAFDVFLTAVGILEQRIAAVDDEHLCFFDSHPIRHCAL